MPGAGLRSALRLLPAAAALTLLMARAGANVPPDPLRVTLTLDRAACTPGDTIGATLLATNTSRDSLSILWTSGQRYDFRVRGERGGDLWTWSAERMFDQALHPRDLAPGEQLTWTERVPMPREAGSYFVIGDLTTQPRRSASVRIACR